MNALSSGDSSKSLLYRSSADAAACAGGAFVGVGGLIVSFASPCVDCGSIANNGFLSSLLILACLISFVSAIVGFSPMISLKYIAGNGALIGLKNAGLLELSIPISCSVAVVVVAAAALCGS